jgi:transcriptional regulator with XRE-family HTH domain
MNKEERRKLNDKEIEHAARLLFKCSQVQLARVLGISDSALSGGLRGKTSLVISVIAKLAALTTDDLEPRPKPKINRAFARGAVSPRDTTYFPGSKY